MRVKGWGAEGPGSAKDGGRIRMVGNCKQHIVEA